MTDASKQKKARPEAHGQVVTLRLTTKELAAFDKRWRAAGFKSRSAYLRHVVRSEIDAPSTTPAILDELRKLLGQLAATGRNLNQTTRAINEQRKKGAKFDPRSLVEADDIARLYEIVRGTRTAIEGFVRGVKDRKVG